MVTERISNRLLYRRVGTIQSVQTKLVTVQGRLRHEPRLPATMRLR
jgi:hypothetical protein